MKQSEELARYKVALQDEAAYGPYPASRDRAKAALDLSQPLKVSTPHRSLAVSSD